MNADDYFEKTKKRPPKIKPHSIAKFGFVAKTPDTMILLCLFFIKTL